MKLTDYDVLTLDCYGTLIDWEKGIFAALEPWLHRQGVTAGAGEVLETFARYETQQEADAPRMLYREILEHVHKGLAAHWDVTATDEDAARFGASVGDWPAFADSAAALRYLKRHYKLVILSNVDRESFQGSNAKLGVTFDAIYTAEDIGSYKPDPANFAYMVARLHDDLGVAKSRILHTAQSLFHDHVPAAAFGLATNWIDRRHGREGSGATVAPSAEAPTDFRAESMAGFVGQHRACLGGPDR